MQEAVISHQLLHTLFSRRPLSFVFTVFPVSRMPASISQTVIRGLLSLPPILWPPYASWRPSASFYPPSLNRSWSAAGPQKHWERMLIHEPEAGPKLDVFVRILESDEAVSIDSQFFTAASSPSGKPYGVASVILHPKGCGKRSGTAGVQKGQAHGQGSGQFTNKGKCKGCGSGSHRSGDDTLRVQSAGSVTGSVTTKVSASPSKSLKWPLATQTHTGVGANH